MSNVEFSEEERFSPSAQFATKDPFFVKLLINWGLAKDSKSANIILIVVAITFFSTSIYFFAKTFNGPKAPAPVEKSSLLEE